ncbi:MAG: HlyD family efflux transporter periplasmic adaptor subunit [Planctomycetota bacterium]
MATPAQKADTLARNLEEVEQHFPALHLTRSSRFARRLGRVLLSVLVFAIVAAFLAPWQQSIRGEGSVVAFDPYERPQPVKAQVKGRIAARGEGVIENAYIEKGALLFSIEDQDPQYLFRLEQQVENARSELRLAEVRLEQAKSLKQNSLMIVELESDQLLATREAQDDLVDAYTQFVKQAENKLAAEKNKLRASEAKYLQLNLDLERKQELAESGLVSPLDLQKIEAERNTAQADVGIAKDTIEAAKNEVEGKRSELASLRQKFAADVKKLESGIEKARAEASKADINIQKTSEEINQKRSKLLDQESKFAVQQTQEITAPISGYIQALSVFDNVPVKQGETLCTIVPKISKPAVQIWVNGNDAPLIHRGDHVRLQFEGWPAVQFSGWPSVAVGTFGGTVALIDATDDGMGKFRVLITPDEEDQPWPEHPYLRQGVRSYGWVLLEQVPLGYEVWRRMNGFPPALQSSSGKEKTSKPPTIKL